MYEFQQLQLSLNPLQEINYNIFTRTTAGKTITLNVKDSDTIDNIRDMIDEKDSVKQYMFNTNKA